MNMLTNTPANAVCITRNIKLSPFGSVITLAISIMVAGLTHAEQVFNPAFLKDNLSHSEVSDLTRFEKSTHQLPGIYRVDIYVNDQYVMTRDVNFIEKADIQDKRTIALFRHQNAARLFNQYGAIPDIN